MKNNFIIDNGKLSDCLKNIIKKLKLNNSIIQNKIHIIINKLYCESNKYIIKNILYNFGLNNYVYTYEEDLYKDLNGSILSIWKNNGILYNATKEEFVELCDIEKIKEANILITETKDIIDYIKSINKNIIIYEDIKHPIFSLLENTNYVNKSSK